MCCLFTVLVFLGPRAVILLWSIADPTRWAVTFPELIWSLLGFLFLPWLTLMYVIVYPGGIEGFDWVWLGLALLADIASYSGGAYGNRNSIPGYGSTE